MFVASRGSRWCPLPPSLTPSPSSPPCAKFKWALQIHCRHLVLRVCFWMMSAFIFGQSTTQKALKHAKNNIQWEQRTREKKRQPRLKYNKQQLREHLPKWSKPQDNSLCGSLCGCCCCCDHLWLPPLITLPMALELVCWPACNVYIHRRPS